MIIRRRNLSRLSTELVVTVGECGAERMYVCEMWDMVLLVVNLKERRRAQPNTAQN